MRSRETGISLSDDYNVVYKYHNQCRMPILDIQSFFFYQYLCLHATRHHLSACVFYLALPDAGSERDLQKVLQQLEPQISFLEELTKMGGAMRTVLTKILTNQQMFKDLSMGNPPPSPLVCWASTRH